ncbi:putative membrane protein [Rhodococcus sp. SORGH_AS303]|nr:putative membrane protein [Rhodococcus sp. SORGH_AS_0303]
MWHGAAHPTIGAPVSTINGLPAHILLVHFIVVLAPLTAVLAILAAVARPVRSRLVWLIAVSAALTLILTPLTTDAGEWLEKRVPRSPEVHAHTELGDAMIYFSVALAVVAALVVAVHLRERRGGSVRHPFTIAVAVLAIVVGGATIVQVYRIGESGARATWSDVPAAGVESSE